MLNLLKNAFASGKASHAYIVVGEKPNIPALLNQCAQVVMCNTHTATDNCERCLKVAQGIHQDVISIPTDLTKNRITVADVSYLVDETYKRPVDNSLSRVFLVNAVDSVAGIGCEIWQNKLLKTLEEPTAGCYIFIGVTDAESLLPTVRSRCQVLKQSKVPQSQIEQKLQSGGLDVLVCQMVAAMCGGSLSSAERLISNAQVVKSYQVALDTAENMTSTKNALPFAAQILEVKENIADFLGFYTLLLRESIVVRLADGLAQLPLFKDSIDKICQNYTISAAQDCIERLAQAKRQLDNGANITVTVDQLLLDLLQIRYYRRD